MSIESVISALKIIVGILASFSIIYYVYYCVINYRELSILDARKLDLLKRLHNLETDDESTRTLSSGWVNQSQFEKMVQKRAKPISNELEEVECQRQAIIQKLPFLNIFK